MIKIELLRFMEVCVRYEEIPKSWQIRNIRIGHTWISFDVSGYKYNGSIQIEVVGNEYLLRADRINICKVSSATEAVTVLDDYIEWDQDAYDELRNKLEL